MRTSKRTSNERHRGASTIHTPKLLPAAEQIRQRAHAIYLARCGAAVRELDDWLQAERELQPRKNPIFTD